MYKNKLMLLLLLFCFAISIKAHDINTAEDIQQAKKIKRALGIGKIVIGLGLCGAGAGLIYSGVQNIHWLEFLNVYGKDPNTLRNTNWPWYLNNKITDPALKNKLTNNIPEQDLFCDVLLKKALVKGISGGSMVVFGLVLTITGLIQSQK